MIYENKKEFEQYVAGLQVAIKDDNWRQYMGEKTCPNIYFDNPKVPELCCIILSNPYYEEIRIEKVISCNTSIARQKIPSNMERVINAVPYILENICMPIAVIKFQEMYYIENGKHRFYAHLLLQKQTIPVSIRCVDSSPEKTSMITISKPYFNNDGMPLAYPEKVLDFYKEYSDIFQSIKLVKMKQRDNISTLRFFLENEDVITFNGCCSSGNHHRSSRITCELLQKLGYLVDMDYISSHIEFCLENKSDANNLNFNAKNNICKIKKHIIPNLNKRKTFNSSETIQNDIFKLHDFIGKNGPQNLNTFTSSFLEVNGVYYYIVGTDNNDNQVLYFFEDMVFPFDNLKIRLIGIIRKGERYYNLFDSFIHK